MAPIAEPTVSVRLIWPFARLIGPETILSEPLGPVVARILGTLGDPDGRLPRSVVMEALVAAVRASGDPLLGLRAGQALEPTELDVLEYAARSASNFGAALAVMTRYFRLMIENAEVSLGTEGEFAVWRMRPTDGYVFPPAASDYAMSMSCAFSRNNLPTYVPPVEVKFMHERPPYADEYERFLETKVTFGASHDTIVFYKSRLEEPMLRTNPTIAAAFEKQAAVLAGRLRAREGLVARVRDGLATELQSGLPSMEKTARRLGMAVATLRRRLEEEGESFRSIVDEVRRELALLHLSRPDPPVSEVAFLLGFSDVRAFARAFRRWTGLSPSEYRVSGGLDPPRGIRRGPPA